MVENVLAAGEQWEAGERILDTGRIMDLRVPENDISLKNIDKKNTVLSIYIQCRDD